MGPPNLAKKSQILGAAEFFMILRRIPIIKAADFNSMIVDIKTNLYFK